MKDCFISNDTSFNGTFKCGGNIIIEGHVEGDVICDNLVKIESGGTSEGGSWSASADQWKSRRQMLCC